MKEILLPVPAAKMICREQEYKQELSYRLTKHCMLCHCADGKLLFNTLTGELILLENGESEDSFRSELVKKRFLVPQDFDENAYFDAFLKTASLLNTFKRKDLSFTVLTTTACNARCYYCYESGAEKMTMSEKTARDVSEHIASLTGDLAAEIEWFGGEPLINTRAIDAICEGLRARGVKYRSTMVTNGYYLNGETLEKAENLWYLKKVQITLDGREEVYNKVKAYTEGGNAYGRVLNNIESARKAGIEVFVRLNVRNENLKELSLLADELSDKFKGKENICVYPALLSDFEAGGGRFNSLLLDAESFSELKNKLDKAGLLKSKDHLKRTIKINSCMADDPSCEVILPDGRLSRCDHKLDKDCFGSIYREKRDEDNIKSWKERVILPECDLCPLYPRCRNLKKCELVGESCPKVVRTIRLNTLSQQIIKAYNEWKEKKYEA